MSGPPRTTRAGFAMVTPRLSRTHRSFHSHFLLSLVVHAHLYHPAAGLSNGVGRLPAMGYNTWNDFRCGGVTAVKLRAVADAMLALGLQQLGYRYLNVDDCWASGLGPDGELVADADAFPDGIAAVADYVHAQG